MAARHAGIDAVTIRNTALFWLATALVFVLLLYEFSEILLPFVAGMALAYLLDPVADRLTGLGLSRTWAAALILGVFVVVLVMLLIIIVPVLATQAESFIINLPRYLDGLQKWLTQQAGTKLFRVLHISSTDIRGSLGSFVSDGTSMLTTLLAKVWSGSRVIVSIVSLAVVTPVVAFYMLIDWDRMIETVDGWLPRQSQPTIRALAAEMNLGVARFVRGQVSVSALVGLFYAVALSLAGLDFGLLIGLFAGLISFVPYLGSFGGGALAIGVALFQFPPDWTSVVVVAVIFLFGQFVEGNVLQPKLIGSKVGLHPVWLMFALFAFGALFGFLGLLIAVPSASALAVLIRFVLGKYLDSPIYWGQQRIRSVETEARGEHDEVA
jgi:predicted PurR-regulated permease PerM